MMRHTLILAVLLLLSTITARADAVSTCSLVAANLPALKQSQTNLIDRMDEALVLESHLLEARALPSVLEEAKRQRRDAAFQLVKFLVGYQHWLTEATAAHCPQVGPDSYSRLWTGAQAFLELADKQVTR